MSTIEFATTGFTKQDEINETISGILTGHNGIFTALNDRILALIASIDKLEERLAQMSTHSKFPESNPIKDWLVLLGFTASANPGIDWLRFDSINEKRRNQCFRVTFNDRGEPEWFFNFDHCTPQSQWRKIVPPTSYHEAEKMVDEWFPKLMTERDGAEENAPSASPECPAEPEPWEVAKAEVLERYPDARAIPPNHGNEWTIRLSELCETGWSMVRHDEPEAWLFCLKVLDHPILNDSSSEVKRQVIKDYPEAIVRIAESEVWAAVCQSKVTARKRSESSASQSAESPSEPWEAARDEVLAKFPYAFTQPSVYGHSCYSGVDGVKLATSCNAECAWIDAAGVCDIFEAKLPSNPETLAKEPQ